MTTPIKAIITGTTGMVGEGVLHQCLLAPEVEAVTIINRKPLGISHPKLTEIIHDDFYDFSTIESQLKGFNACFFCLGISSNGIDKDKYYHITYTLTMHIAHTLSRLNPEMTFCYVSGAGTDSTEKSRMHWARVKGKTENDLMKLPFKQVYAFRPGFILPTPNLTKTHSFYKYISWMFPLGRALYPQGFAKMNELGRAMIKTVNLGTARRVIEGKEIIALGKS
ncbi:epimerase [Pedobacter sp. MC2016-15]|uniref:epimerase n=1 Tax=Pedobacter sp. MC2016-15 TaxID=2994473 RepID=UPI002247EBC0|nr:epimerase [Pedobacter sp. MC2016-15]MCX2480697.1 epimerase [Pedobacter sp. MC2016-15]